MAVTVCGQTLTMLKMLTSVYDKNGNTAHSCFSWCANLRFDDLHTPKLVDVLEKAPVIRYVHKQLKGSPVHDVADLFLDCRRRTGNSSR
jgi:hypothetical protein